MNYWMIAGIILGIIFIAGCSSSIPSTQGQACSANISILPNSSYSTTSSGSCSVANISEKNDSTNIVTITPLEWHGARNINNEILDSSNMTITNLTW